MSTKTKINKTPEITEKYSEVITPGKVTKVGEVKKIILSKRQLLKYSGLSVLGFSLGYVSSIFSGSSSLVKYFQTPEKQASASAVVACGYGNGVTGYGS
jgi:hypothetical protein